MSDTVKIVECPRDAMQGWPVFIDTQLKINYLRSLLQAGFYTIDCGSFVSPKAIPQMRDTAEVLDVITHDEIKTPLLTIVANLRGAEEACKFQKIGYLGFPFSISETFQQKNTNAGINEAFERLTEIQELVAKNDKQLVVYISMGFGNPYGDVYNEEIVYHWVKKITDKGVKIISLADTVGLATAKEVFSITAQVINEFKNIEIGVHLHSTAAGWQEKLAAALDAGTRRIDTAIKGYGGCPLSGSSLVGNLDTEKVVQYLHQQNYSTHINLQKLAECSMLAATVFNS